jgi:uncharacterized protein YcsI (UPF0317 family)
MKWKDKWACSPSSTFHNKEVSMRNIKSTDTADLSVLGIIMWQWVGCIWKIRSCNLICWKERGSKCHVKLYKRSLNVTILNRNILYGGSNWKINHLVCKGMNSHKCTSVENTKYRNAFSDSPDRQRLAFRREYPLNRKKINHKIVSELHSGLVFRKPLQDIADFYISGTFLLFKLALVQNSWGVNAISYSVYSDMYKESCGYWPNCLANTANHEYIHWCNWQQGTKDNMTTFGWMYSCTD